MRLPNPDRAVVDLAKLANYSLDMAHDKGKHKARVFASVLGIRNADARAMRELLLTVVRGEAQWIRDTIHGPVFVIDFEMKTATGAATIRSGWIVRTGEDFPRLTTCFVK